MPSYHSYQRSTSSSRRAEQERCIVLCRTFNYKSLLVFISAAVSHAVLDAVDKQASLCKNGSLLSCKRKFNLSPANKGCKFVDGHRNCILVLEVRFTVVLGVKLTGDSHRLTAIVRDLDDDDLFNIAEVHDKLVSEVRWVVSR